MCKVISNQVGFEEVILNNLHLLSLIRITTMSCSDLSSIPRDTCIYITHLEYHVTTFYEQKLLQNIECVYIQSQTCETFQLRSHA